MNTCVIIPIYNESKTIGNIVKEVRNKDLDVLVIDDGSKDMGWKVAEDSGAVVLKNEKNVGKGASLAKGFSYALEKNYDAVITMDGDGQHLPEDLPYFIRLAKDSNTPILIGNRMQKTKRMPLMRILTNKFMSWLLSAIAKQKIPDTQCGLRLIKTDVLRKVILSTNKYETESEILIKASKLGFKIESVPIKTVYNDEKSQIHPVIDTLRFFRFIFKELFKK